MGGYGSTRWSSYTRKTRVEESLSLTADLFRSYPTGAVLTVSWGEHSKVQVVRHLDALTLAYEGVRTRERVQEHIPFEQPHGRRWYFRCPDCGCHAGKLYKPFSGILFRCRLCHHLTYQSIQERRKYQSLARTMARYSGTPAAQWERFFTSDWGRE